MQSAYFTDCFTRALDEPPPPPLAPAAGWLVAVEVVVPSEATLGAEAPPPQAPANSATTTRAPSPLKVPSVRVVPNVANGHRRLAPPACKRCVCTVPLSLALLKSGAPGGR